MEEETVRLLNLNTLEDMAIDNQSLRQEECESEFWLKSELKEIGIEQIKEASRIRNSFFFALVTFCLGFIALLVPMVGRLLDSGRSLDNVLALRIGMGLLVATLILSLMSNYVRSTVARERGELNLWRASDDKKYEMKLDIRHRLFHRQMTRMSLLEITSIGLCVLAVVLIFYFIDSNIFT